MKLSYSELGRNLAKSEYGFSGEGDWTLLKCFYEEGKKYGEFFFNFNSATGEAEITAKDPDYANALLEAFERMLKD